MKFSNIFLSSLHFLQIDAQKSPNVVLLLADDLGMGDISLNNKEGKIKTPNIGKLIHKIEKTRVSIYLRMKIRYFKYPSVIRNLRGNPVKVVICFVSFIILTVLKTLFEIIQTILSTPNPVRFPFQG